MIYKSYLVEKNIDNLKQDLALFYGENLGLRIHFKKLLKLKFRESETLSLNQDEVLANPNLIYNELSNLSLFENKKVIFIDHATDKIVNLIDEIKKIILNNKVFLFSEALDKRSKLRKLFETEKVCGVIPCYADNEISIKKIISENLKEFDGLTPHNINLIADNCNLDRVKLDNEINKIKGYFYNKRIETEKLEILLDAKIIDNFSELRDNALLGNKTKTNLLLSDTIIEKDKNVFYINSINQRLNKLKDVREKSKNSSLEQALENIKPPIFWKDKPCFLRQAQKWDFKKIKKTLEKTYQIEITLKSNNDIDKNVLMKKLIVDLCHVANS